MFVIERFYMDWYKISQNTRYNSLVQLGSIAPNSDEREVGKNFTESLVLFRFKNGWTIQRVEKDYDAMLENHYIPANYSTNDKKIHKYFYSLRNEHNVPRANFIGLTPKSDPSFFGILEINYHSVFGNNTGNIYSVNHLLKEFFDYLRQVGMKPQWMEDEYDLLNRIDRYNASIKMDRELHRESTSVVEKLAEDIKERNKIAPIIRNYGGNSDSYGKALQDAYTNETPIEDIYAYAVARKEEHLLESALQNLSEWADNEFYHSDEYKKNIPLLPPVPKYPTKEMFTKKHKATPGQQEIKTKVSYFDEQAYKDAMYEYTKAENELQELENELRNESKAWKFLNECYRKLPKDNK